MAEPSDPTPVRVANIDDVYVAFNEIGGRDPVYETGEHTRFVGMEYTAMRLAVRAYLFPESPVIEPDPPPGTGPVPIVPTPGAVGGDLAAQILQKALAALAAVQGVKTTIEAQLKKKVEESFPGLAKAMDAIQKQIGTSMETIIPNTLALVGAALGGVDTLISTFLSNAADIGDIADTAADTVKGHAGNIGGWFMDLIVGPDFNLAGEIGAKITSAFAPDTDDAKAAIENVAVFVGPPPPVDF